MTSSIPLTLLYVPADRADRVAKALQSDADVVIVDLEDAVAPGAKDQARRQVRELLAEASGVRLPVQVRVNGSSTPWQDEDLEVVRSLPDSVGVRVPKCESAADVVAVADRAGSRPVHVLVESALGVEHAFAMACADSRVASIGLGEADLRADLGVRDDDGLAWARSRAVNAAAAGGLAPPAMSVYTDVRDLDGLAASCEKGKALGFVGRAAIHPTQLPVIRAAFTPSEDEIAHAREILAAWESALAEGSGAVALLGGSFVDAAVVRQARRVLDASGG